LYGISGGLFGFISIATLAIMSIERFLVVNSPFRAFKFNLKQKIFAIIFTWLYSFVFIGLQLFSENSFVLEGFMTTCSFDYLSKDMYTRILVFFMFIGGFLFPLAIIIIFYTLTKITISIKSKRIIFVNYRNRLTKNTRNGRYSNVLLTNNDADADVSLRSISLSHLKNDSFFKSGYNSFVRVENKVLKIIILNIIFFCVAWVPYAIVAIIGELDLKDQTKYINLYTSSLPALFAKTSSIYNPILYTFTNKDCKKYFKIKWLKFKESIKIRCCCFCCSFKCL